MAARKYCGYFTGLLLLTICVFACGDSGRLEKIIRNEANYKALRGSYSVAEHLANWRDESRQRDIPVKIYYPKAQEGRFPVICFSHGLGGSRDAGEYLGRHWASHGYVSVHVQHIGSDASVWDGKNRKDIMPAMQRAASNPVHAINRPQDISFVVDTLSRLNNDEKSLFYHRLDMEKLGISGHSFGSHTTMLIAGQTMGPFPATATQYADSRFKAAIPMSSPVPRQKHRLPEVYRHISIPCFHMTGTLDNSSIGNTPAEERRLPYDNTDRPDQYLLTFNGGDHMVFSGRTRRNVTPNSRKDPFFHHFIKMSSIAFWDAYLKKDEQALAWLTEGQFARLLGTYGVFEQKADKTTKPVKMASDTAPQATAAGTP